MTRSDTSKTTKRAAGTAGERHRALHELVTDQLRDAILQGELYAGQRLVEDRLAQQYEVSRHPVREALRTLHLEGLVDISPRRGATVSQVSADEAAELFEVLAALDALAARLASASCDEATAAAIRGVLEEASAVLGPATEDLSSHDLTRLAELNREFHTLVTKAAGNRHLSDTIMPLRDRIHWIQAAVARRRPELSWAEHDKIFTAISSGDAQRAEILARNHIDAARILYLSHTAGRAT